MAIYATLTAAPIMSAGRYSPLGPRGIRTFHMNERLAEGLKIAVALPVCQIANMVACAGAHQGWPARIGRVILFLPIFVMTTACWASVWIAAVWLAYHLVK